MTPADLQTGVAALRSYVSSVDGAFEAWLVADNAYESGVTTIIETWDSLGTADNPDALDLKYAQCGIALYQSITAAGYGSDVTADQCAAAAQTVVKAVRGDPPTQEVPT